MNAKISGIASAIFMLAAVPALAATVTLDDFSTNQVATAEPTTTTTVDGRGTSGIGADFRDFTVSNSVAPGNPTAATKLEAFNGIVTFDNDSGARGSATLTYRGVGDLMNTRETGAFFFDVIAFDSNADFTFFGRDTFGNEVTYTEDLISGFSEVLRFSELTGYQTFDFSSVDFLSLTIDSTDTVDSVDGRLSGITVAAIPLPASGLLLLGVLGGAAALRRRKTVTTA